MNLKHLPTKTRLVIALLSLISLLLLGSVQPVEELVSVLSDRDPRFHQVVSISDGDTIVVDLFGKSETVRLIGVDTPETHHPSRPVQCFGVAATKFTTELIGDSSVRLELDPTNTNRDRYDRLLRYVYLEDGRLVNAEIIKQGYGFAYLSFPFTKQAEFELYELQAEINSLGLWNDCDIELENGYINTAPAT